MPEIVFVSYAREDSGHVEDLSKMINPYVKQGVLELWIDSKRTRAGDYWAVEIDTALESAKVAVLFVSTDFLASEFIEGTEFPKLRAAIESRGLRFLWILVSACLYETWGLNAIQAAHDINFPLAKLDSVQKKDVLREISVKIRDAVVATDEARASVDPSATPIASLPPPVSPAPLRQEVPINAQEEIVAITLTEITENLQKRATDFRPLYLPLVISACVFSISAIAFAMWENAPSAVLYGLGGAILLAGFGFFARAQSDLAKQQIIQARFLRAGVIDGTSQRRVEALPAAKQFIQRHLRVTLP